MSGKVDSFSSITSFYYSKSSECLDRIFSIKKSEIDVYAESTSEDEAMVSLLRVILPLELKFCLSDNR